MLPQHVKDQARQLRSEGVSVCEIARRLGISKGTVSPLVANVRLTEEQRAALKVRTLSISPEQRRLNGIKGGTRCQELHGSKIIKNLVFNTKADPNVIRRHEDGNYVRLVLPGNIRISEHRYIMEQYLGRSLRTDEHVHHRNENGRDNRLENLELLTNVEHALRHGADKTAAASIVLICPMCTVQFARTRSYIRTKEKLGQKYMYCSHRCSRKAQRRKIDQ